MERGQVAKVNAGLPHVGRQCHAAFLKLCGRPAKVCRQWNCTGQSERDPNIQWMGWQRAIKREKMEIKGQPVNASKSPGYGGW